MELTCPACRARYDAPDAEIPRTGRVVRCSACRAEWIARGPAPQPAGPERATPPLPAPEKDPAAPDRLSVAARPDPSRPGRGRAQPMGAPEREAASEAPARDDASGDPGALIDSLRDEERAGDFAEPEGGRRGGAAAFMAGFATVALLALAAATVYVKREDIAAAAPTLAEPLAAYGGAVDRSRVALERLAERARESF